MNERKLDSADVQYIATMRECEIKPGVPNVPMVEAERDTIHSEVAGLVCPNELLIPCVVSRHIANLYPLTGNRAPVAISQHQQPRD